MFNKCEKVITIPQFTGTCWFNSILMVTLYSHRMRQLLRNKIKSMDEEKKTNPLMKIFIDVIESKYFEQENIEPSEIISKLQLTPEEIILYLNKLNPYNFYYNHEYTEEGFISQFYISRFLNFFELTYKNVLVIDYITDTKKFYISQVYAQETITPEYRSTSGYPILKSRDQFKSDAEYYKHVEKIKLKQDKYNENITNFLITIYKKLYENYKNNNLDILIINYPKIHVLKDERVLYEIDYFKIKDQIEINNNTFILDSMIFNNYNIKECKAGHSIAGITCNNKRYIYNGWTSQTTDPSMLTKNNSLFSNIPCALIPYDWFNPEEDLSFCLNSKECKLDFIDLYDIIEHKLNLCFNFKKGENMHIFINKNSLNPTFIS